VPKALGGTIFPFHYNVIEELEEIIANYGNSVGVIVMEPFRYQGPQDDFLLKVKEIARKNGSVLIFDEITSGWRHHLGGVHMKLGIEPDMAVFAKAVSNGVPMAAVIGKRAVMDSAQNSFISSTYWTERIGPSAALAAIKEYRRRDVPRIVGETGSAVHRIWKSAAEKAGLALAVEGPPALSHFSFTCDNAAALGTLLTQELLKQGILGNTAFYTSAGHDEKALQDYEAAVNNVFPILKRALDEDRVEASLEGPVAHKGFTRLT
jgi:glutamate-1-semialdehyde 2,1-aminomutase